MDDDSHPTDLDDGGASGGGVGSSTGGYTSTGGRPSTGGATNTGGATTSGGATSTGGGLASGGSPATGGTAATGGVDSGTGGAGTGGSTVDPDGCIPMATDTDDSGSIGVEAVCFTLTAPPKVGWQVNSLGSRTMSINGTQVTSGQLPFPGSAPFIVEFSAGEPEYTSWSFW